MRIIIIRLILKKNNFKNAFFKKISKISKINFKKYFHISKHTN